ncbi:centromere-associated protein E-like [Anopheles funestus]|uniref:centromere-associated protein E-like n=1 Tax=Anopheles funestus TaxID=62324 RepID=UPI0020C5D8E8|nr:centromere-associated protein E-like [Anopheles funestus]
MTSQPIHDESDVKQRTSDGEMGEPNGARPSQTWHHMLLYPSPSSSQLSYVSEIQTDGGSQPSTPLQQPMRHPTFGELDESATNYDSGNFSLSESGGKEKLTFATVNAGHGDMHQRFVQLNTELYQTKTELLTYKYKWNEIRNEIELGLSKKIDKLLDEKNEVEKELEDVRKELARLKAQPTLDQNGRDLLRIRSELDEAKLALMCKEQANESLKQKIVEQHVEKENLAIKIKALEHQLFDGRSEISGVKSTERWYRDELHRCQNENAKLKDTYASLEKLLCKERTEKGALVEAAREAKLRLRYEIEALQHELSKANKRCAKTNEEIETNQPTEAITSSNNISLHPVPELLEKNEFLAQQNIDLHAVLCQLQDALQNQRQQFEALSKKEQEALKDLARLQEHRESDKSQIETLTAQLAHECFTKRQIDVSVEKLKAQLKVLSINFTTHDSHRPDVKECESLRQRNHILQEQCNRLINEQQQLKDALAMCTEKTNPKQDEMRLMENFRCIQSKNLDLELKLGQCVSFGNGIDGTDHVIPSIELVKRSEQTIKTLQQDVQELEQKLFPQHTEKEKKSAEKPQKSSCPKHGSKCWENVSYSGRSADEEDVEIRNLRIMLKAIESENRRRMKRYELNNRTLLKKVKEHTRERKQAEQRVEELTAEHAKCATLRCEMSSARERCLLMEADMESYKQEAATLRSEKDRLIDLLENNCLLTNDGDVWGSLKRAFKELHELKRVRKENVRLHDELQRDAAQIEQLEATIDEWKVTADAMTAEVDDVRFELTEKALQLEESQRTLLKLTGENTSLEQTVSMAGRNEMNLTQQLNELKQLVQVQEIRLETAHERLKLYEQSEAMIVAAKDTFFTDLQSLQDAILLEKQEKYELEEEVRELRQNMVNAVGNSLQNFHPRDISAEGSGHLSAAVLSPEVQSLSLSCTSLDIDQLRALVEQSAQPRYSLQPLHECVSSLKLEMDNLNSVLQIANHHHPQQQTEPHQRFPLSLMDELNDATNGRYGSR